MNNTGIPALKGRPDAISVAFDTDRLGFLLHAARELGPVARLWPDTIMITGAAEVDAVFKQTNQTFLYGRNFRLQKSVQRPGSAGLTDWMRQRRAALAATTPALLSQHRTWLAGPAATFTTSLLHQHMVTNLIPGLEQLTSASISRFCLGTRNPGGVPPAAQALLEALFPLFATPFDFPAYMRRLQPREWRISRRYATLRAALHTTVASPGTGGVAEVLAHRGLDDDAAVTMLAFMHLAARGVPAAALTSALVELAKNPGQQELAAAAAAAWDGTTEPPPALGWAIDETLRLWPPTWMAERVTEVDTECGAWTIPAGSMIVLPFWVIHRVAAGAAPPTFDLTRWQDYSPPPGSYAPYGGGPRWCMGARFAHVEMVTILAAVLRRARLTIRGQVHANARRTLTPEGYELILEPR
jgi:cytochrome P450